MQNDSSAKVTHYKGREGLKKVTLNSLAAKDTILIYEVGTMNDFIDKKEAEDIRREFMKRNTEIRQLTNHAYLEPWTEIEEFVKSNQNIRYIDPRKFEIKTEILIYNDIVAMYDLKDELFCIEIHDAKLAEMQKQMFNYFWRIAEKPVIGRGGRTSLF